MKKRKLTALLLAALAAATLLMSCAGQEPEASSTSPGTASTPAAEDQQSARWFTEPRVLHGQSGYATNFNAIYTRPVKEGIAAFSFECCGGNRSGAKSEGSKLFPAHYTSSISDLETVLTKVKTLDYVDTDHIFLFGESYGGVTISLDVINHNEIPSIILLSAGISVIAKAPEENDDPTYIPERDYDDPLDTIKAYL